MTSTDQEEAGYRPTGDGSPSRRFRMGRICLLLGTTLVLLFILEVALEVTGVGAPVNASPFGLPGIREPGEAFTKWDRDLMYTVVPHSTTYPDYDINSWGFRTPEFERQRPRKTLRVVCCGDSTTFGLGVGENHPWPARLQSILDGIFGDILDVEVISAGVCGYSTYLTKNQIERDLLDLNPHVLVVCVTGHNDTRLVAAGRTDPEIIASHRSLKTRLERLHLAQLLRGKKIEIVPVETVLTPGGEVGSVSRVSLLRVAENLRDITTLTKNAGIPTIFIATAASAEQKKETPDILQVGAITQTVSAERGVGFADVRPRVAALSPYPLFVDGIHPTPLGHQLIAEEVLQEMALVMSVPEGAQSRLAFLRKWVSARQQPLTESWKSLLDLDTPPALRELWDNAWTLAYTTLPRLPAFQQFDPLHGAAMKNLSEGRWALNDIRGVREFPHRLEELTTHVRPEDQWLKAMGGVQSLTFTPMDIEKHMFGRALIAWEASIGLPHARVDLRLGRALLAKEEGRYPGALHLLDLVLDLDPMNHQARYERAWVLRRARQGQRSHEDFETLAQEDLEGPFGSTARGLLSFEKGDWTNAESSLRQALSRRPSLSLARYLLGRALYEQQSWAAAARELTLARILGVQMPDIPDLLQEIDEQIHATP